MTAPTELYTVSQTVGATERSLPLNGNYSSGTPVTDDVVADFKIKILAMAAGDQFQFRVLEKVAGTGSTQYDLMPIAYLYFPEDTLVLPAMALMHGWDITGKKLAGTDRTVEFSARGYA